MHLTNYEKETIILFNEAEDTATCDTCSQRLITKLDKLCARSEEITVTREDEHGKAYKFPKKWVQINIPRKYSEEQREKMADRLRALHNSK